MSCPPPGCEACLASASQCICPLIMKYPAHQTRPHTHTHTHTHTFNGPLSRTTRVSLYQKCKTNLDFTEARDSEWQWHQLGHMQVCTSLHTDNHASTPPLSFLQAGCPSCRPTNSVKALEARALKARALKAYEILYFIRQLKQKNPPQQRQHRTSIVYICTITHLHQLPHRITACPRIPTHLVMFRDLAVCPSVYWSRP